MQDLLSILFYIRKKGVSDPSQAIIYLRITYNGKRAEVSTMRKVAMIIIIYRQKESGMNL